MHNLSLVAVMSLGLLTTGTLACRKSSASSTLPTPTSGERPVRPPAGSGTGSSSSGADGATSVEGDAADADAAPVYFAFDSSELTAASRERLNALAAALERQPSRVLLIEGHTDAEGTEEYNLALGERRALVIRDYLARLGVAEARLQTITYGEERPADPGSDEAALARNRRGAFVVRMR